MVSSVAKAQDAPSPFIFTDAHIGAILSPTTCVRLLAAAMARAGSRPQAVRHVEQASGHAKVFGWGDAPGGDDGHHGFRCYSSQQAHGRNIDVSTLYRTSDGALVALHVGRELGAWRNGAAGALAVQAACGADDTPLDLLIIGAGLQAYTQLACIAASRPVGSVRIVSRSDVAVARFIRRCSETLSLDVLPAGPSVDPRGADVIVCATFDGRDLLKLQRLDDVVHINAIGAKALARSEIGREVYAAMDFRLCDNLAQLASDWDTLEVSASGCKLADFAALGPSLPPIPRGRSIFLCRGITGFEVELLASMHTASAKAAYPLRAAGVPSW